MPKRRRRYSRRYQGEDELERAIGKVWMTSRKTRKVGCRKRDGDWETRVTHIYVVLNIIFFK